MKITTIPAGDDLYLMRSVDKKIMVKMFQCDGRVYWIQYSTLDEDSNDNLVDSEERERESC